ncbi:MAG: glycosyltransferase [Chlamydiae bacterium]|nr:glycosyltransferase [Chlamydiota bacterium]
MKKSIFLILFIGLLMSCQTMNIKKESDLNLAMRKLWMEHVIWTRGYIVASVADSQDANAAAQRLLKNQEDIGNAVIPYYGNDGAKELTRLLKEHIMIAVEVINAAKANDNTALDIAQKKWHDNSYQLAAFLNKANPAWKLEDLKTMLHEHLTLTTNEVVDRIQKKYDDDVQNFDKVEDQALKMADVLSSGIAKQFPDKFKG